VNLYEYGRSEIIFFGKFSFFFNDLDVEDELSSLQPLGKMAKKDKQWLIFVKSFHLNNITTNCYQHFSIYLIGKLKYVMQLIPSLVWKVLYADYRVIYLNNPF
jgi:hypothetical protein